MIEILQNLLLFSLDFKSIVERGGGNWQHGRTANTRHAKRFKRSNWHHSKKETGRHEWSVFFERCNLQQIHKRTGHCNSFK